MIRALNSFISNSSWILQYIINCSYKKNTHTHTRDLIIYEKTSNRVMV